MGVGGQRHTPAALIPRKTLYPLYRRPGGPQNQFGRVRKISPTPGFDPRNVQPVASRYTAYSNNIKTAILVSCTLCTGSKAVQTLVASIQLV
jgi:hypothetical protein